MNTKNKIEISFTPDLFSHRQITEDLIVVVTDILRASTAICAAFENGVQKIIPVAGTEQAKAYKEKGYLVAAERDGVVLDFADFGNSPFNFMTPKVVGKTIAYSTTNGTKAINALRPNAGQIAIGAFTNISALSNWLEKQNKNLNIVCAGWKNKFSLEDSLFAGALAELLCEEKGFTSDCDSVTAAMDLWKIAKTDLLNYVEKCAHRHRLRHLMLDDVIEHSFTLDLTKAIPVLQGQYLENIQKNK